MRRLQAGPTVAATGLGLLTGAIVWAILILIARDRDRDREEVP